MTGPARLDPGQRVLEHHRAAGRHVERLGRGQEGVRRRLAAQAALLGDHPVHPHVEQPGQARGFEHQLGVRAGRHDRRGNALSADRTDVGNGSVVYLNATGRQLCQDQVVLAIAQPVDGGCPRRVVRRPLGEVDAPRLEERPGAVQPGLAVDVGVVIGVRIERDELGSRALGALAEEFVEHLLPRRRVHHRGLSDHPVHVEQAGRNTLGKPEHRPSAPGQTTPGSPASPLAPPGQPWPVPRC
jgi:hypothetical protein